MQLQVLMVLIAIVKVKSRLFFEPNNDWIGQEDFENEGISAEESSKLEVQIPIKPQKWQQNGKSNYSYGYGVSDSHTGDVKTAQESSNGGYTKGSYSVLQPDGILRTVLYESDPWNGFRATVYNKGWGFRQNSHGWGGFEYKFKDNKVASDIWVDAVNRH